MRFGLHRIEKYGGYFIFTIGSKDKIAVSACENVLQEFYNRKYYYGCKPKAVAERLYF